MSSLPTSSSSRRESQEMSYLSIIVTDAIVQTALWELQSAQTHVVATSSMKQYDDLNSCIVAVDEALQELGPVSESVDRVVFALPDAWIVDDEIDSQYQPLLKRVATDLSLEAVGFVALNEILEQQLKTEDEFISAVVASIGMQEVRVMAWFQGKLRCNERLPLSDQPLADVLEGLARCAQALSNHTHSVFPPRLVVTSFELADAQIKKIQASLLAYDWVSTEFFHHPPAVTMISGVELITAVASQSGTAIARSLGLNQTPPTPPTYATPFSQQQDANLVTPAPHATVSSFGVPVSAEKAAQFGIQNVQNGAAHGGITPVLIGTALPVASEKTSGRKNILSNWWSRTTQFFTKNASPKSTPPRNVTPPALGYAGARSMHLQRFTHRQIIAVSFIAGLGALLLIGWVGAGRIAQAHVLVTLATKPIQKETRITVVSGTQTAPSDMPSLRATPIEHAVSGERTVEVKGIKLVGEEATGVVTLFNKTTSEKTFAKNTPLKSNALTFFLDEEVTVPAATVSAGQTGDEEVKKYGKADAKARAQEIGKEGNLAQDAQLTIANFDRSTYAADVSTAFTGGDSREARVVAQSDLDMAAKELTVELLKKANEELPTIVARGTYVLPATKLSNIEKTASAKVGDEATTVTVQMKATINTLSYTAQDLHVVAQEVLAASLPPAHELVPESIQILSDQSETASGSSAVVLEANITAIARPQVNPENWSSELKGKTFEEARRWLNDQEAVKDVAITVNPPLVRWLIRALPSDGERIQLRTQ